MGSNYQMMQQTQESFLTTQDQILTRLTVLERRIQWRDDRSWGQSGIYGLPAVSSTPIRNRSYHVQPSHPAADFRPAPNAPDYSVNESTRPTSEATGGESEPPLPLPFTNTKSNTLDSSEIAKSNAALISVATVLAKYPKLRRLQHLP